MNSIVIANFGRHHNESGLQINGLNQNVPRSVCQTAVHRRAVFLGWTELVSDPQRARGRRNRTQKGLAASLQFSFSQQPFHPAIMRCQEIEICRASGLPLPPTCRHQRPSRVGHHIPGISRGPHDVWPDYLKQHRSPRPMRRDFSDPFFLRCKVVPPTATNLHELNARKASPRAGQKRFPRVS